MAAAIELPESLETIADARALLRTVAERAAEVRAYDTLRGIAMDVARLAVIERDTPIEPGGGGPLDQVDEVARAHERIAELERQLAARSGTPEGDPTLEGQHEAADAAKHGHDLD